MRQVCTFADGHRQHEAILDYGPATRSYRYTIDGGLPVADNRGRQYNLETDMRAMEGTYVATDGSRQRGLFALI